jgi:hypothetical protein
MALVALAQLAALSPAAAQPAPPGRAEEMVAAYQARIREAMGGIAGALHCPPATDGAIVVCGRNPDAGMRLPLGSQPEAGARRRLIAGEPPSGREAMAAADGCVRACYQPVTIPIIPAVRALGRGLDRLLHPD